MRWKFTSDGSVNGWGWRFTVFPLMPCAAPRDLHSDRRLLSRPLVDLPMCLLDPLLSLCTQTTILSRLAASLALCAQLSSLGEIIEFSFSLRHNDQHEPLTNREKVDFNLQHISSHRSFLIEQLDIFRNCQSTHENFKI